MSGAAGIPMPEAVDLLGIRIHHAGPREILAFFDEALNRGDKAIVLNLNVHCMNLAARHPWLHQFINEADLVYCDGDGVRWGLTILGHSPPPKVTYNVWLWELCRYCADNDRSVYFLGARPGVAEEAARNVRTRHPTLRVVGTHHGHFTKEGDENEQVIAEINRLRPDFLIVCFGMPTQEKWIRDNWQRLDARIFLKAGAAFDYAAGVVPVAPTWMVRLQLEWLFRLLLEPRRLFARYVLGNPCFIGRVIRQRLRQGRGAVPSRGAGGGRS